MSCASSFIQRTLDENPVVIFSKSYCPYCKMAKQVFSDLKVAYLAVELDNRNDADDIQKVLGQMTGASTVPRVFVNKKCIGGGSDVQDMYKRNELQPLLKSVGILK